MGGSSANPWWYSTVEGVSPGRVLISITCTLPVLRSIKASILAYPVSPIAAAKAAIRSRTSATASLSISSGGGGVILIPVPPWNFSSSESTAPSATVRLGCKACMVPSFCSTTPTVTSIQPLCSRTFSLPARTETASVFMNRSTSTLSIGGSSTGCSCPRKVRGGMMGDLRWTNPRYVRRSSAE